MVRSILVTILLLSIPRFGFTQNQTPRLDSLMLALSNAPDDTTRIIRMADLCHEYAFHIFDSSFIYGERAIELSEKINFLRGKSRVYFGLGRAYLNHGDLSKSFDLQVKGLKIADENQ